MNKTKGIYKLTSPSGKIYIGQSIDLKRRLYRYSKADCKRQAKLYNAINKYGFDNFTVEILYETNKDFKYIHIMLDAMEKHYIKQFDCIKNGYNLRTGGANGAISEETRKKMSEGQKNRDRTTLAELEARKKIALSKLKTVNQYSKDGVFIKEWISATQASKELNISRSNISSCITGKRKTTGGYMWKLKEEDANND